jgi:CRP-like cAMP-binding protein
MERNLFARNGLLKAVEPTLRPALARRLTVVDLARGDVLYGQGDPVDKVYFPLRGLVGILAETTDGQGMNSTIVGREGAVGAFEACGSRQFFAEAVVQVAGEAAVLSAATYRDLFNDSESIRTAVHQYVEQLISETRQSVICQSAHGVEARLSRMILEALDRSGAGEVLPLTQETLARMVGTQRTTIAEILSRLQREAIISTRRGSVALEDRTGLEALACSCRENDRFVRAAIRAVDVPSCDATLTAAE